MDDVVVSGEERDAEVASGTAAAGTDSASAKAEDKSSASVGMDAGGLAVAVLAAALAEAGSASAVCGPSRPSRAFLVPRVRSSFAFRVTRSAGRS